MQAIISGHIVLCNGTRLYLVDFEGQLIREWLIEANIKCLKVRYTYIYLGCIVCEYVAEMIDSSNGMNFFKNKKIWW